MFLRIFHALMPKQPRFVDDFIAHAATILGAAKALQALITTGMDVERYVQEIRRCEHDADEITHKVLQATHKTFLTPFDRRQIQELIMSMDDAVDLMEEASKEIVLYRFTSFTPEMKRVADITVRLAEKICKAMPMLAQVSANAQPLQDICQEVSQIESEADMAYYAGMEKLRAQLGANGIDAVAYQDHKEIYETLEGVVDHIDDTANIIEGIVLEQV